MLATFSQEELNHGIWVTKSAIDGANAIIARAKEMLGTDDFQQQLNN
jgi:hypothetical protein